MKITSKRKPRTRAASRWRDERQFMAAVIKQCDAMTVVNPVYGEVYHVSNENAHRNPGVRGGIPDLQLDIARYDPVAGQLYHGWRCELKIFGGLLSEAQQNKLARLKAEGYYVIVVWEEIREVIDSLEWYLALERSQ